MGQVGYVHACVLTQQRDQLSVSFIHCALLLIYRNDNKNYHNDKNILFCNNSVYFYYHHLGRHFVHPPRRPEHCDEQGSAPQCCGRGDSRATAGLGPLHCIAEIAERIQQDFLRWPQFDKSARVACHSAQGVIELMPIADPQTYAFKYVNGHPQNGLQGLPTVMAFGVVAECDWHASLGD